MRDGIFLPSSHYKKWFTGRVTGLILAAVEGTAIVTAISHFALHAHLPELLLAAAIGVCTLTAIFILRRCLAMHLHPDFAVAISAWIAVSVGLFFCVVHFCMQKYLLSSPTYIQIGDFLGTMNSALTELPSRRDGIIEMLSVMQLTQAAIHWLLVSLSDVRGATALLFLYNALICIAIARFFSDVAVTFNINKARQ